MLSKLFVFVNCLFVDVKVNFQADDLSNYKKAELSELFELQLGVFLNNKGEYVFNDMFGNELEICNKVNRRLFNKIVVK